MASFCSYLYHAYANVLLHLLKEAFTNGNTNGKTKNNNEIEKKRFKKNFKLRNK